MTTSEAASTDEMERTRSCVWIGRVFAWCEENYLYASCSDVQRAIRLLQKTCDWCAPGTRILGFRAARSCEKRLSRVFDAFESRHIVILVRDKSRRAELMLSCHSFVPEWLEVVDVRARGFLRYMLWWCKQMRQVHRLDHAFEQVIMERVARVLLDDVERVLMDRPRKRRLRE